MGNEYRQILALSITPIPKSILRAKRIGDTVNDSGKVSAIQAIAIL
jgi:hypothetical protein